MPQHYAIIGAGPSGLAGARNLDRLGLSFDGFESAEDVGGLWNIDNPRSTVYESAHLISSRTTTEFSEFPMPVGTPDYPNQAALRRYFSAFADTFDLRRHFSFGTEVTQVERDSEAGSGWKVTWRERSGATMSAHYDGVVIANGTLATPTIPTFRGTFTGEIMHTSQYKSAETFHGKRVLIIGAGNSGCDLAIDAVHHAASIDMSVRRGYYFVPKYIFGRPSDTNSMSAWLPTRIKQAVDTRVLRMFTGNPERFGFPKPDYRIYESHPIVNTLVLHHLGQGDLQILGDIDHFDGSTVHFADGSANEYDLIVLATGYQLAYPFIDRRHLNWTGMAPNLFLNVFASDTDSDTFNGIYLLGMIEALGLGWQGRYEQAELLAQYLASPPEVRHELELLSQRPWPNLSGGYRYLALERMSYYVNKDVYRRQVKRQLRRLRAQNAKVQA